MTQLRTFLLFVWLFVAYLLWDAWQRDYVLPRPESLPETSQSAVPNGTQGTVPGAPGPSGQTGSSVPRLNPSVPATEQDSGPRLVLANDVLRLSLDAHGGSVLVAELLQYSQEPRRDSEPVQLLSQESAQYFVAQSGLIGTPAVPSHETAMQAESGDQILAEGQDEIVLPFRWRGADGIEVERSYRLTRGSYVLEVTDRIINHGSQAWNGNAYQQLLRVQPPPPRGGFTNPSTLSYVGAAWYSPQDKFEKLAFEDFESEPLQRKVNDGWVAMLQHYFVAAVLPQPGATADFSSAILNGRYLVRAIGPDLSVAPGAETSASTRFYFGPKLRQQMEEVAPGLGLTMDYGIFTVLAQPMHWLLSLLHWLTGNWGWAIVLLVVVIKAALFKLSEAQYKSFARMRRVQPRIEALKERYGDDRQKFQTAMMELYKKEKINPLGGCLPILLQIPIFLSLYWVLVEAVELRHAPWILWIQNLTAPDPYFVLPVINLLTMWATQKLSPAPGMDPIQRRMMQAMPIVFGVMFAFFPAGLVLYWTTNGLLGLLQQWIIMRRHAEPAAAANK